MKRFAWLLLFPYVVTVSTEPGKCLEWKPLTTKSNAVIINECLKNGPSEKTYSVYVSKNEKYSWASVKCDEEMKDYCYDQAEALNMAHERRTRPIGEPVKVGNGIGTPTSIKTNLFNVAIPVDSK